MNTANSSSLSRKIRRSIESSLLLALVLIGRARCGDRDPSGQLVAAVAPAELGDGVALYQQGQTVPVAWHKFYRADLPPQDCKFLYWFGSAVDEISWPCILHNEEQNLRCVRSQLLEDALFHQFIFVSDPGIGTPSSTSQSAVSLCDSPISLRSDASAKTGGPTLDSFMVAAPASRHTRRS